MGADGEKPTRTILTREEGFRFRVRFDCDGVPDLLTDEPPPLGHGSGPDPSRLLAAAVGNCLASSLLFCMRKAHLDPVGLETEVDATIDRDVEERLRIRSVLVRLVPRVTPEDLARMGRCLDLFESLCAVTESMRHGIDIAVAVEPALVRG